MALLVASKPRLFRVTILMSKKYVLRFPLGPGRRRRRRGDEPRTESTVASEDRDCKPRWYPSHVGESKTLLARGT